MPIYALGDVEPRIHPEAYVHPDAIVIGDVTIEAQASVWPTAVLRGDYGRIVVGERTSIQDGTVVHCTEERPTLIGSDCVVGHNAHMEACTIEDHCLIGSGSVVLGGVVVGVGSVVGAKAMVPEDTEIASHHIALGVPARSRPMDERIQNEWIAYGVREYLSNSVRYRAELRRID